MVRYLTPGQPSRINAPEFRCLQLARTSILDYADIHRAAVEAPDELVQWPEWEFKGNQNVDESRIPLFKSTN